MEQATIANTLARMERDGLIERRVHPRDKRAQQIFLTDKARGVIEARYFNDRNSTEIGEEFAMKPVAVRKMLFHARQSLAECLKTRVADAG